jgi:YesN/AraC family two-component response regulator
MIDIHVARETAPGIPEAVEVQFYTTEFFQDMVSYLDSVCEFHHRNARVNAAAIKGLLLAEFSLLLTLVETSSSHLASSSDIVGLCQWLIQHNVQDEALGVESLASELGCSPNYLSKLFHKKTGERITERINRLRIQNAVDALRWTRLSVKSIAAGCGYSGSNYFCRIFRQATGRAPQQYRDDLRRIAQALEKQPKVLKPATELEFAD